MGPVASVPWFGRSGRSHVASTDAYASAGSGKEPVYGRWSAKTVGKCTVYCAVDGYTGADPGTSAYACVNLSEIRPYSGLAGTL